MVEKIQLFPSNRRISYATPSRQRKNPTNSFSIPIVGICYRWKTSDKKPQPFSKKTPDPPAGPALVDLQKAAHLLAGDHASIYYLSVALLSLPRRCSGLTLCKLLAAPCPHERRWRFRRQYHEPAASPCPGAARAATL